VPEDFFVGVKIFGDTEQLRKARWQYEPGVVRKEFGFEKSPLSDVSFLTIVSSEITSNRTAAVILAISSFAILVSLAGLVRPVTFDGPVPRRILFGVLWLIPLPVFALLSLVVVLFDAPSVQLIALSASVGGILAVALIWFYSRLRRRSID